MSRLLRLYPGEWRERYEPEMRELLAQSPPTLRDRLDLARGALDARLHAGGPRRLPAWAAVSAGALWTAAALITLAQPPLDWPGYGLEILPLAIAGAALAAVGVAGGWLRLGDATGSLDRLAVDIALAGHVAWVFALLVAALGLGYGAPTALASAVAAVGTAAVGLALARRGDWPVAGLLLGAGGALALPGTSGWLLFGLCWSAAGLAQLAEDALSRPAAR